MIDAEAWKLLEDNIIACRVCPRLVAWREQVARQRKRAYQDWEYWGRPVPGFGDKEANVLVVGLAPGAHGSNRTGRMFTGDASGNFLYAALHRAGFANQPWARQREDGLILHEIYISAVCRCAPPANKPRPEEIANCRQFLLQEIALLKNVHILVALGRIAFDQLIKRYAADSHFPFKHGGVYSLQGDIPWLVAAYHPSRQNTQTGRLTEAMFDDVWRQVRSLINSTRL